MSQTEAYNPDKHLLFTEESPSQPQWVVGSGMCVLVPYGFDMTHVCITGIDKRELQSRAATTKPKLHQCRAMVAGQTHVFNIKLHPIEYKLDQFFVMEEEMKSNLVSSLLFNYLMRPTSKDLGRLLYVMEITCYGENLR